MTVTYIHHSAFLVQTDRACLLLDWFEGELPPIAGELPVYVLSSHSHADHFSEEVFSLFPDRSDVTYLLSEDIRQTLPEPLPPGVRFLGPGQRWQDGVLCVETFPSTDEGVAFWITLEGKQIYHAGDLNHWYWEEEDAQWNRDMTLAYRREVTKMAGRTADVAFLPVDPRLGDWFYLGARDFLEQVTASHIFPMHFWGDFSVCRRLADHPELACFRDRILTVQEKGQQFNL